MVFHWKQEVDLRYVEQLIDSEQTGALGALLKYAVEKLIDGKRTLPEIVELLCNKLEKKGCLFCQKAILPADMQCQDDRKYMHALTDTGDPESDLPISQKAVQSIGLRGKRAEKFQG